MSKTAPTKMEEYLSAREASRRKDLLIQIVSILMAVVLVIGAGRLASPINKIRKDCQLTFDKQKIQGLPPDVTLFTKLGTLRGLAINVAFTRLEELKQENRFTELKQLSDALCKMIPRSPGVWSYSAWNMAYNISVCEYTNEARWRWVYNGITNLRNLGLVYNPKNITLYKELAWIFHHKIGDRLDDSHMAYKRELAVQMQIILGEPPLGQTTEEAIQAIREIKDAPEDVDEWIQNTPEAAEVVAKLREVGLEPDFKLLVFVAKHMMKYSDFKPLLEKSQDEIDTAGTLTEKQQKAVSELQSSSAYKTLLAAIRRKVLIENLNMQPYWMVELMEEYGPIDWRSPFAHSMYWATYGDMYTKGSLNIDPADSMNAVRFIFFALNNMARMGDIILEPDYDKPNQSFIQMLPDVRFIRPMHEAYLRFGKEQFGDDPRFIPGTSGPNYLSGHRNFLLEGIRQLYLTGEEDKIKEAKEYYFYLRKFDRDENGDIKPQYRVSFDEFVYYNIFEALETYGQATTLISQSLERSLTEAANGNTEESVARFNVAKKWWKHYMKEITDERNERRSLEPIGTMRRDIAMRFMTYPYNSPLQKHRVWLSLDLPTRQAIYDNAYPEVEKQCKAFKPPFDAAKVMPIPPGMEDFRKNPEEVIKNLERFDPEISVGEKKSE